MAAMARAGDARHARRSRARGTREPDGGRRPALAVVRPHGGRGRAAEGGPPPSALAWNHAALALRFVPVAPQAHAAAVGLLLPSRDLRTGAPAQARLLQPAGAARGPAHWSRGREDAS